MAQRREIIALIAVAAVGAGVGGVTQLRASRCGHGGFIVVPRGRGQNSAAVKAHLGRVTCSSGAGIVALCGNGLIVVGVAAGAIVFHHAVAAAGVICQHHGRFPAMSQGVGVVGNVAVAAAVTGISGVAQLGASGRSHDGFIVVAEGCGEVAHIGIAAGDADKRGEAALGAARRGNGADIGMAGAASCGRPGNALEGGRGCSRGSDGTPQGKRRYCHDGGPIMPGPDDLAAVIFQPRYIANRAAVFNDSVLGAGRVLDDRAIVPKVAGGVHIVPDVAVAAAGADKGGVPALGAGGSSNHADVIMAQGIDVIAVIGQIAVDTVEIRVSHFQAGCRNDGGVNVVALCLCQYRAADGAELGIGAGGLRAGGVADGRDRLALRIAAGFAGVLHHAVMVTDGGGQHGAVIHAVAGSGYIVVDEAVPANGADVQHISACGAGGRCDVDNEVVSGRLGNVLNMPVPADAALPDSITGGGAGGSNVVRSVPMLALRGDRLLHVPAVLANVHRLALHLAGGVADHDGLIGVGNGVDIVAILNQAALDADVAVIAKLGAGGRDRFQQRPAVIVPAAILTAGLVLAASVLAIAVRSAAAAGAAGIVRVRRAVIPEPDVGNAVLGHFSVLIAISDLVIHGVLAFLRVVGRRGQGAVFGAVAVADGGIHARFGQVGNRQGVGLAVHHAEVVRDHALGSDKLIFRVLAKLTVPDDGKPLVTELRNDVGVQRVTLQATFMGVLGAVAERAVVAAVNRDHVIGVVHIFIGHFLVQRLNEIGVTVIKPIDVFGAAIILSAAVGVHRTAGVAAGFCPMVAGVGGIHAGNAVQDGPRAGAVQQGAVRILDVPGQRGLAVAGVFRRPPDGKRCRLAAYEAVKRFRRGDGVYVQLIGPVDRFLPVFGGVAVKHLFRKHGGGKAHTERQDQEQGDQAMMPVLIMEFHAGFFLLVVLLD